VVWSVLAGGDVRLHGDAGTGGQRTAARELAGRQEQEEKNAHGAEPVQVCDGVYEASKINKFIYGNYSEDGVSRLSSSIG